MRRDYHARLDQLMSESSLMCRVATNCLRNASTALLTSDLHLAEQVMLSEAFLDQLRAAAEAQAMELLALQAPVASELRTVVSALWVVADLQRMGALAVHIAEATRRRHPAAVLPAPVRPIFEAMSSLAVDMAERTGVVLSDRDLPVARSLEADDLRIDQLQRDLFAVVLAPGWSEGVAAAVDISLLSRYYERFGDHAVAIARRVVFMVIGLPDGGASLTSGGRRGRPGVVSR